MNFTIPFNKLMKNKHETALRISTVVKITVLFFDFDINHSVHFRKQTKTPYHPPRQSWKLTFFHISDRSGNHPNNEKSRNMEKVV